MAVLVEAISVITRRDSIDRRFTGGWARFTSGIPNATLCSDGQLARVGFCDPQATREFVERLCACGLVFQRDGKAVDIAVVDQQRGPTTPCGWLEFARIPVGSSGDHVAICWLFEGPRIGAGLHLHGPSLEVATPDDWQYEGSLSQKFTFVPD